MLKCSVIKAVRRARIVSISILRAMKAARTSLLLEVVRIEELYPGSAIHAPKRSVAKQIS